MADIERAAGSTADAAATAALAAAWLARFEQALARRDRAALAALFHADSHWRDLLAFTWRIRTINGAAAIIPRLLRAPAAAAGFCLDRSGARHVTRAGRAAIEAIFRFDAGFGPGSGVLRLTPDADGTTHRAWTLLTALDTLHADTAAPAGDGKAYARDFRGPNWLDLRRQAARYDDRDPAVLVVGGGQAGLSVAARLAALHVDTLIVDRGARIGDNWRRRYHALVLHNQTHVNHLPLMPFPPTWPTYIPKDKLAAWFEGYAESLELNVWTGTTFEGGQYDHVAGRWQVTLRGADGARRELRPRHVVMATGVSGIPHIPDIPTLDAFRGTLLHSSQYEDGEAWAGRRAIVIGTGNSGHDIAQDLHAAGAQVTMVQRSPTLVVNVEPSAQLPYAIYGEGLPLEETDLIAASMPLALARESHRQMTAQARRMDAALLEGLERAGFRLDFGADGTGWQFKYLTRGGGYYFNVGCSDLIVRGEIALAQYDDLAGFAADGARTRAGTTIPADLIVLATGYRGQEDLVRQLFGTAVAARIGPIWGFGDGDELRNMYQRTAQPGLWFIAGSLAQCRIYSRPLALQIKAAMLGLLPDLDAAGAAAPAGTAEEGAHDRRH